MTPPKASGRSLEGVPRVGDLVAGKYEVERVLGVGGMGVVVAARHRQLGELVAIKLLHADAAMDGEAVARLLREARATISIKSEHVVRVIDVGTLETGSPYILMEYLSGSDLGELVQKNGHLAVRDAVDYVLQACEAIAEAHARGIVHRDLKPSNLFLTERADDGSSLVKVLDFGISKALVPEDASPTTQAHMSLTATRAVFGSPLYMSPEQVRSAKRVDERTDIWALGIILHELLTGSLPFFGETTPGVLASIVADPPEPLRKRRPDAPEGLETVILHCLVKDVNQRLQSVTDLAKALAPFAGPGAQISVDRIVRVSLPGAVSKRALPRRLSTPPPEPSMPPAEIAMGSTVKAITTTKVPRASRRGALAVAAVALSAIAAIGAAFALGSDLKSAPSALPPPALPPPADRSVAATAAEAPPAAAPVLAPSLPSPPPDPVASAVRDAGASAAQARPAPRASSPRGKQGAPASSSAPRPGVNPPDDALNGR